MAPAHSAPRTAVGNQHEKVMIRATGSPSAASVTFHRAIARRVTETCCV